MDERLLVKLLSIGLLPILLTALLFPLRATANPPLETPTASDQTDLSADQADLSSESVSLAPPPAASFAPNTVIRDAYGYTLVDSLEPGGGCAPTFEDISATGANLGLTDETEVNLTLPFAFTLYGNASTALRIGNNGGMLFGVASGELPFGNTALGPAALASRAILPFWDDIDDETGGVFQETRGATPNRRTIIQWNSRPHFNNIGGITFQAVLHETSNTIDFIYSEMDFGDALLNNGASATVGIRQDSALFLQYSFNAPVITNGLALCLTPPPPSPRYLGATITADPALVTPGSLVTYTLSVTNVGELAGTPTITNPLPLGTSYSPASVSCSLSGCSYDSANDQIVWQGPLAVGANVRITFAARVDANYPDIIVNQATISDPAALVAITISNNSVKAVDAIFRYERFENGPGGLVAGPPGEWEHGIPTHPTGPRAFSGANVWATDLDADADDTIVHHYLTATVALPADQRTLQLLWRDWYAAETGDFRRVLVNGVQVYIDGAGSAQQRQWLLNAADLSVWSGQTITINFDFQVSGVNPGPDGWYVDDLAIVALRAADPALAPASLAAFLHPEQALTQTVTLSNDGHLALDWSVYQNTPTSTLLYDNGPLVNSPGTGAGGADQSVLQTASLGMNTLGAGVGPAFRLGEDLLVDDPQGWEIDTLTVYAYQTGSISTTTSIAETYLRIWNGPPFLPSSSIVFGDMTTNRMIASSWSGAYRVTETTSGNTQRPIMRSVVGINATLPPGRYWLEWRIVSVNAGVHFAPPIVIQDVPATGNALQSVSSTDTWIYLQDTGNFDQQGFPFLITGSRPSCAALPDWVNLAATSGSVAQDGSAAIDLGFNAEGLAPGVYTATLCLETNAPDRLVVVPLTLNVGPADLKISKTVSASPIQSASTITYSLAYSNTSAFTATDVLITETVPLNTSFNAAANPSWTCGNSGNPGDTCVRSVGDIGPGAVGSVPFAVQVVASLPPGVVGIANTAAIAERDFSDATGADNQFTIVTPVQRRIDATINLVLQQASAPVGGIVTATLTYSNNGPDMLTGAIITAALPLELSLLGVQMNPLLTTLSTTPPSWQTNALASQASGTIILTLQVQPTSATSVPITATINAGGAETNQSNNSAQTTLTIDQTGQLKLHIPLLMR